MPIRENLESQESCKTITEIAGMDILANFIYFYMAKPFLTALGDACQIW